MWKIRFPVLVLLLTCLLMLLIAQGGTTHVIAANTAAADGWSTDQIIIKFSDTADTSLYLRAAGNGGLTTLSEVAEMPLSYVRAMSGDAHVLKLEERRSALAVSSAAASLSKLDDVLYAEPDWIKRAIGNTAAPQAPTLVPNDTLYNQQWHYKYAAGTSEGLNLQPAWDITTGSASVVVAVVDTGILNHTDLAGRTVPGYDFIGDLAVANDGNGRDSNPADPGDWITTNECGFIHPPQDSSWHGTHVAGTIGAASNNGTGVAGVDWNAKILPVRTLGKCGGYTSDIVDGVRWAAGLVVTGVPANANPADVINMSLGGLGSCTTTEQNAYNQVHSAGTTIVVAAGNDNANASNYSPASCNNVITVAATDRTGDRASYSNFGSVVEVSAPGGETFPTNSNGVLSTLDGGTTMPLNDNVYVFYQGTSMAAPHVAGLASLIIGENPTFTPNQVLSRLQNTARPFPGGSSCTTSNCGDGIVDAYDALNTTPPPPPSVWIHLPAIMNVLPPPDPIINGDFESGSTGWTETSSNGFPLILASGDLIVTPRSGNYAAWLGGADNEISVIAQDVTVPASTPFLTYYHWIGSADSCGNDFGGVLINGATIADSYTLCTSSNTGGWVKHSVNLSGYAGQSINIQIRAETNGSLNSNLFVDDVSFAATAVAPAANPDPIGGYHPIDRKP